jgi:hypothetical protein
MPLAPQGRTCVRNAQTGEVRPSPSSGKHKCVAGRLCVWGWLCMELCGMRPEEKEAEGGRKALAHNRQRSEWWYMGCQRSKAIEYFWVVMAA